jgi:hypothetical protein
MQSGVPLCYFILEVSLSPGPAPVPQVVVLEISLPFSRISRIRPVPHRSLTLFPLVIEGQVRYLLVRVTESSLA